MMFGALDCYQQHFYPNYNNYSGLQQFSQQTPVYIHQPDRIQAVLAAGAIKSACESSIAATEKARREFLNRLLNEITDLPETTSRKVVKGWFTSRVVETINTPTEAEQEKHRAGSRERACQAAENYYSPSAIVKTLLALASHYPPSHPIQIEGSYLTAIAPFLAPFEAEGQATPTAERL